MSFRFRGFFDCVVTWLNVYGEALLAPRPTPKLEDHPLLPVETFIKYIRSILKRRIERKIEDILGEDQFGFRRGKGTRDAIGMMRKIGRAHV
jgi:hypothetical protein